MRAITASVITILVILLVASGYMTYCARMDLLAEKARMPKVEILRDKRNGDIFIRIDGDKPETKIFFFEKVCPSISA